MRLAIISDVHGNLVALEAVLDDIQARGVDAIVNLGDCVTSPLWTRETFELLDTIGMPTVRGNNDRSLTDTPIAEMPRSTRFTYDSLTESQREALGALPSFIELQGGILAVHGRPSSDKKYLLHDKVDGRLALASGAAVVSRLDGVEAGLILCGHSHAQHVALSNERVVINPGSVGCPRYADDDDWHVAEVGSPHARFAIATERAKGWGVELIALEYDWAPVVERARANGRADWAAGFLGAQ
jgi:predicted phosphodiesterase